MKGLRTTAELPVQPLTEMERTLAKKIVKHYVETPTVGGISSRKPKPTSAYLRVYFDERRDTFCYRFSNRTVSLAGNEEPDELISIHKAERGKLLAMVGINEEWTFDADTGRIIDHSYMRIDPFISNPLDAP